MNLTNTIQDDGKRIKFTFFKTDDFSKYSPITQSYGFCYTKKLKLVVGKHPKNQGNFGPYSVPGGTVERGENPVDTLIREVDEEVSLTIKKYKLMGVQKVEFLDENKETIYQFRFACLVDELKEMTPDPDCGLKWERKLIDSKDFLKHVKWGIIGEYLAKTSEGIVRDWLNK